MLTYRTGAAGAPSAARFMSEHLLQQTLPPEMAAMAEYYEQGVTPPTPADAAASRHGHLAVAGRLPLGGVLEDLVKIEVLRLAESALTADGALTADDELTLRAIGEFEASGLIGREESLASLDRFGIASLAHRLEAAVSDAGQGRDYSSATASPRRDMNPALAQRLGIDARRGLTQSQVAFLLNGQRADGAEIKGWTKRATTLSVGNIFQLDHRRKPTRVQMERVLAGSNVNGVALPPDAASIAVRRLLAALGVRSGAPSELEIENIRSGKMADGRDLSNAQFQAAMDTSKARIGYIDFTFSAPKSVSVAWAFAPTKAERAIIHQAHSDAIDSVMRAVEFEIGRA